MIQARCGHCGRALKAPDHKAGKTVRCPGCQEPINLPADGPPDDSYGLAPDAAGDKSHPPTDWEDGEPPGHPVPRKRRKSSVASKARLLFAIPIFVLAVGVAAVTAVTTVVLFLTDGDNKLIGFGVFMAGAFATTGLFWVGECVKEGRLVAISDFINVKDGE